MVSTAATMLRSNSSRVIAKNPSVISTSWPIATKVETPNCHSKRNQPNKAMAKTARMTARMPFLINSSDTLPETVSVRLNWTVGKRCLIVAWTRLTRAVVAAGSLLLGSGMRTETVRGSPNCWSETSPNCSRSMSRLRSSSGAGRSNLASTIRPPTKSTPRLSPRVTVANKAITVSKAVSPNAQGRSRTKRMLVLSGTSFRSRIVRASNVERRRTAAADVAGGQHAREGDGGEHRGHDADQKHDRETLHRPGAEQQHDDARNGVGRVRLEDGAARFLLAQFDRHHDVAAAPQFLADAFVDQHVGVDRRADGEHEAGDPGQGQRGAEHRHHREDHEDVQHHREVRIDPE